MTAFLFFEKYLREIFDFLLTGILIWCTLYLY